MSAIANIDRVLKLRRKAVFEQRRLQREIGDALEKLKMTRKAMPDRDRAAMDALVRAVCQITGIAREVLVSSSRRADLALARQAIMWIARAEGIPIPVVAQALKRTHPAVCYGAAHFQSLLRVGDGKALALHDKIEHARLAD